MTALLCVAVGACSPNEANDQQANPTGAAGSAGQLGSMPADFPDETGPGVAGAAGSGAGGSGGALDAGARAAAQDAGRTHVDAAAPDTGAPESGTAPDAGPAQPDAAPVDPSPTDYRTKGPYDVAIEKNVGSGFRNDVPDDTLRCQSFIGLVGGANPEVDEQLRTYPADMDRGLYTLFRPAQLEEGKKYPVITWGNGTCSHPLLFSELLEHLASHGFIIIASNSRWVAGGVEMLHGIDFILSENENASSALYGKIDTKMLGACGHSQGSGATVTAGADERIVATVPIQGASAAEVAKLNGPTFLIAGELDTLVAPSTVVTAFNAATVPAVYGLSIGQDHLMPGLNPSPILDAVTAWFKIHLSNDSQARELFYGDRCKLCEDPRWQIMRRSL